MIAKIGRGSGKWNMMMEEIQELMRRETMSRRKTKTERELVADISDVFRKFCNKHSCIDCPYRFRGDCKLEYIKDLLDIYQENNEEE